MPTSKSRKKKTMPAKKKSSKQYIRVSKVAKRSSPFSNRGLLVFALLFAVVGSYFLLKGFAASPNGGGNKSGSVAPLAQTVQQVWNNPNSPPWCDNEDDVNDFTYYGSLSGSFTTKQVFCGTDADFYNNVYWDAGGEGLGAEAYVVGSLTDMTVTAPSGDVHHAVLVGSSSSKGVTTSHYQVCYVPRYSLATDTGGSPLPAGSYTYSISGNFSKAIYYIRTDMTDAKYQQTYCPVSQRDLSS